MNVNKPVVIYGAGHLGGFVFAQITYQNIPVAAFVDRNAKNKVRYYGCEVFEPDEAIEKYKNFPWIIAIGDDAINESVKNYLNENNITAYNSFKNFYAGTLDANLKTTTCGDPFFCFQIALEFLRENSIVYSFGIGNNYSFECNLTNTYNCKVFSFDPSPEVVYKMKEEQLPYNLKYYEYGLSDIDGIKAFHIPSSGKAGKNYSEFYRPGVDTSVVNLQVYQLSTLMKKLGHTHLDLLKMDIEGSEFIVLPNILQTNVQIKQLCLETHARIFPNSIEKMQWIKKLLNQKGFLLISNESNEQTYIHNSLL